MKVLHLSRSILANAPIHISDFLNKYSNGAIESRCITSGKGIVDKQDVHWKIDETHRIQEDLPQFAELLEWCDIVHIHNQPPIMEDSYKGWELLERLKKPIILQVHSEPEKLEKMYHNLQSHFPIAKIAVIAQYHAVHMFTPEFEVVRNVIDINDPLFAPPVANIRKHDQLHVTFSPSNLADKRRLLSKWKSTWAYKSYYEVWPILEQLEGEDMISFEIFNGVNFRESIEARSHGDIHIDDIYTGSYHLSSLEGLTQGKVVICNLKPWMTDFLRDFLGTDELPWLIADKDTLYDTIKHYAGNWGELFEVQKKSRLWMEKHWAPELVYQDYHNIYKTL